MDNKTGRGEKEKRRIRIQIILKKNGIEKKERMIGKMHEKKREDKLGKSFFLHQKIKRRIELKGQV